MQGLWKCPEGSLLRGITPPAWDNSETRVLHRLPQGPSRPALLLPTALTCPSVCPVLASSLSQTHLPLHDLGKKPICT